MYSAGGAALPDLVEFLGLGAPLPGQERVSCSLVADAHGIVREDGEAPLDHGGRPAAAY